MRSCLVIAVLASIAFGTGCFPFGNSEHRIIGDYELQQFEDGATYYLVKRGAENSFGGGVIDGTVVQIGWNSRYILVDRHANFRGDPDGWMIVDTQTGQLLGPTPNSDLRNRPEVAGIRVAPVKEAWSKMWF
jgi:hypothetical protein